MELKMEVAQTLALSQRMIQSAEILQMSSQELETYLKDMAVENPVIDIEEHYDAPKSGEDLQRKLEWLAGSDEQNRVYYINSPQSIYYSQYDSDFNYLNYAYFYDNTIGKHYPIGNKIYRFGNNSLKLLTNYGTIINIENNSNDITTKYEGTIMDAGYENSIYLFACDKDYFYPLMYRRQRNEKDIFYIEKRAFNDPLTTICKSKEFTETPLLLKAEKGKIVLISQETLSKDEWDRNVYTMPVYYEVFDASLNSVSKK